MTNIENDYEEDKSGKNDDNIEILKAYFWRSKWV